VVLVGEPPDHLPHTGVPGRPRTPPPAVRHHRRARQRPRRSGSPAHRGVARRESHLGVLRVALRRLLRGGHRGPVAPDRARAA
jgi:hypothetical protein